VTGPGLPTDRQVNAWLAAGEGRLGVDLEYCWAWLDVPEGCLLAKTRCWAPAPDGEPYFCTVCLFRAPMAQIGERDQRETVLHELAHVADFAARPWQQSDPHGPAWGAIMSRLGLDASGEHVLRLEKIHG